MVIPVSIAGGLVFFCLVVLIFANGADRKDRVRNRIDTLSTDPSKLLREQDPEFNKSFMDRIVRPAVKKLTGLLSSVIPMGHGKTAAEEKRKLMLQQAGWTISAEEYMTLQLVAVICCGILGAIIALITKSGAGDAVLYAIGGAFAAYAIMRYVCSAAGTRRKSAMEKQLPDALDLLSVSVTAGLGFERALLHIVETMEGPLIDEFAVSYREMSMGRSRRDALTLLGERCGIEDLAAVTGALVQAGQLGIPISNVLQSQSAAIRRTRRNKVKEKAAKVSTKILLPMVGLIFPVLLIVLLGPSIITIVEEFS